MISVKCQIRRNMEINIEIKQCCFVLFYTNTWLHDVLGKSKWLTTWNTFRNGKGVLNLRKCAASKHIHKYQFCATLIVLTSIPKIYIPAKSWHGHTQLGWLRLYSFVSTLCVRPEHLVSWFLEGFWSMDADVEETVVNSLTRRTQS